MVHVGGVMGAREEPVSGGFLLVVFFGVEMWIVYKTVILSSMDEDCVRL